MNEMEEGGRERSTPERKDRPELVSESFVADLDARMAASQLKALGWRERGDLDAMLADLEALSHISPSKAIALWDKHRPDDDDKPLFIDNDDKDPPGKAKTRNPQVVDDMEADGSAQTVGKSRNDKRAEDQPASEIDPTEGLKKRYRKVDARYYYRDKADLVAFEDKGRTLTTAHDDPAVARAMVELAEAKGWQSLKLKGSEAFRREVWLEASLKGVEVEGYKPRDVDVVRLAERRDELERPHIRPKARSDRSQPAEKTSDPHKPGENTTKDPASKLTDQQRVAVETMKALMRERNDGEEAITRAAQILTERFESNRVYVGKVIEKGTAPFENDPKNNHSPYIRLQTQAGERTLWGKGLPEALEQAGAGVGDDVALTYQGKFPMQLTVAERDKAGKVIGAKEIVTHRSNWEAQRLDQLRDTARTNLTKVARASEAQPLLRVYDRNAPKPPPQQETSRRKPVDMERSRS